MTVPRRMRFGLHALLAGILGSIVFFLVGHALNGNGQSIPAGFTAGLVLALIYYLIFIFPRLNFRIERKRSISDTLFFLAITIFFGYIAFFPIGAIAFLLFTPKGSLGGAGW